MSIKSDKPLRILLVTYQGDVAGSTHSIRYLAEGLAKRGHTVVVGCRKESLLFSLLTKNGVIRYPMTFEGKLDGVNMRQIRDCVRKYDIQLINAQSSIDRYTAIFANWIYRLGVEIVHTRRQMPLSSGGFLQAWFYTRATSCIVAVSNGVKEGLVKTGIPKDHIVVIPNGTPASKYEKISAARSEELRQKFELFHCEAVIGCVSRKKRQEQLLQAAGLIDRKLCILLVGIEEEELAGPVLEELPDRHRLICTGSISGEEALRFYPLFDLFVLPSVTEGLSQSLLEAMALGVPVIATRAGGNTFLIRDGQNGLLFEDGKLQILAEKMVSVLDDEELRKKLTEGGKKTALRDFSIQKTIDRYERFFRELIEKGQ